MYSWSTFLWAVQSTQRPFPHGGMASSHGQWLMDGTLGRRLVEVVVQVCHFVQPNQRLKKSPNGDKLAQIALVANTKMVFGVHPNLQRKKPYLCHMAEAVQASTAMVLEMAPSPFVF